VKTVNSDAVRHAEDYVLRSARVLERRRFDFLFGSGSAEDVVTALLPYRNPDGGFGNALEPDGRGPGSQPVAVSAALSFMDEVGAVGGDLVTGICDYLVSISAPDGGLPFVHPNIRDYPRAPWWQIPEVYQGSLLPTGSIAGLLHKNKFEHPWLSPATEFCWRTIDTLTETSPYEALAAIQFLDQVPDGSRAEAAAARLGELVRGGHHVSLAGSGESTEELHYPYDFAPTPESLAVQWFTEEEFSSTLDLLVESQKDDGSWPVRWAIWTPATASEWGGWVTIEALKILRAHGRWA
jgi:hypothetical protein